MELTSSERSIMNIKEQARILEEARRKAYENRLAEIVSETQSWRGIPTEAMPMKIAERAFKLGFECGANKMYEYL